MAKRLVTLTLTVMMTMMAWADIVTVSTEKLWTFPSSMTIPTDQQVFEYEGLYIHQKAKSDNSGYEGFSLNSGRSYTSGSFSDGTEWSSNRSLVSSSGRTISSSYDVDAPSPTYTLSLQTTTAGTLYVIGGNGNANAKSLNIYFKDNGGTNQQVGTVAMAAKSSDSSWKYEPYEAKATVESGGVFYIAGEAAYNIYAIHFVPTATAQTYAITLGDHSHGSLSVSPETAAEGETVTVTADPDNGYKLSSITITKTEDGSQYLKINDGTMTFTMPAYAVTVKVNYGRKTYNITYDLDGGSLAGDATNPTTYDINTADFTLINPSKDGYTFAGWTGTDLTEPTMTVTITKGSTGDRSYTATWTEDTPAVIKSSIDPQISINSWTYGATASSPVVSGTVGDGVQTIEYKVRDANDDTYTTTVPEAIGLYTVRVSIAETDNYLSGSATADFEIGRGIGSISYETTQVEKATEDQAFTNPLTKVGDGTVTYTSSNTEVATVDGSSGEVTIVGAGETTITATVENGSNYDYETTTATYLLTVSANPVTKYAITLGDHSHGSLSVSPETATEGETVTVTADPDNGYKLSSITITKTEDGSQYLKINDGTMTFTMPAYAVTVKVNYGRKTYNITYDLDGGSLAGDATNPTTYDINTADFTLINPSKDGYTFAGWTGTDLTEPTMTVTITKGSTGDRSYTATWTEDTPAVIKSSIDPQISINSWTYGATASSPVVSGTVGDGVQTIEYKVRDANDDTYTTTVPEAIGLYTVRVSIAETDNYLSGSATADFEIGRGIGSISYETTQVEKATEDQAFTNPLTKVGDGTVTYTSSNTEVATVDGSSGEVTIVGAGETTITATVENGSNYDYETTTATYLLTVSANPVTNISVPMILVAGQSNADGRIKPSIASLPYDNYTNTQISYCNGVNKTIEGTFATFDATCDAGDQRWGFDAALYGCLETALGSNYYVVKQTKGSTAISTSYSANYCWSADATWLESNTSANEGGKSLAKALISNVKACVQTLQNEGKTADIKCLFWHQGESDRGYASAYKDNLTTLIAYIRSELAAIDSKYAHLPIIVGTISQNSNQYNATIDGVFRNSGIDNFYYIDMATASMYTGDSQKVHFDATSATYLGKQMYNKMVELNLISGSPVDAGSLPEPVVDNSTTYDFKTWATDNLASSSTYSNLTLDDTAMSTIDGNTSIYKIEDLEGSSDNLFLQGRFAIADNSDNKVKVRGTKGLYINSNSTVFSILDLNPGDAVTVTYSAGTSGVTILSFLSNNAFLEGSETSAVINSGDVVTKDKTYIVKSGHQLDLTLGSSISASYYIEKVVIMPSKLTESISAPAISKEVGSDKTTVTITAENTNLRNTPVIYYMTDGNDPTSTSTQYSAPFDITTEGETTIKAIAVWDTLTSDVVSTTVTNSSTEEEVTLDLDESGSKATMTIENNEATLTGVTIGSTATTIAVSGTVGANNVPVKSIAADAFNSITDKSAIKSVDLSATAITDVVVDRSSGVFSGFPDETMIYMPASNTAASGQKNVIIDGTCSGFEMKDEHSYNIPKDFTATTATLSRTFTNGTTCTICLPYAIPAEIMADLGKIYYFSGISGTTVQMTEQTEGLAANTPYIFVPSGNASSITASSVTVSMSNTPETENTSSHFTFKGVFGKKEFTTEEISNGNGVYGFAADSEHGASVGQFVKASSGTWIEGMRAYLAYNGEELNGTSATTRGIELPEVLNVVLIGSNGSTTNIGRLELMTAEEGSSVYNLSGQRVDNSYKGIVISNGKKMIKK